VKHIGGFSGGIDSQALALWMRNRFPPDDIILMNSQAGKNESTVNVEFVEWYSANVFPVVTVTPLVVDLGTRGTKEGKTRDRRQEFSDTDELTFDRLAYVKGIFPSRKAQFCTEHLKMAPQRRWIEENLLSKGIDYERYSGVRRDESDKRKNTPFREWDTYYDCYLNHPLADWTKLECFAFCKEHGEKTNPLYEMGFSRVGCAPCINSGKDDIRLWSAREPAMIDKVRAWEKSVGRTFFAPMVPGMAINWIDDVLKWAKTTHGGKQYSLPFVEIEAENGSCSSKYGLCE
jgi:3'-phosphoadenosine 5'-phosphosulfate sulfotransferase (PAPS reductase)/FAD synthetase